MASKARILSWPVWWSAASLAAVLALPAGATAENNCPWLNEATASGLLEGSATGAYRPASGGQPARCTFTLQQAEITRTLSISVEVAADPHARVLALENTCHPKSETLPAIGNESGICSVEGRTEERVVGRVRDQVFVISLGSSSKKDVALTPFALKTRLAVAAEQVAGNLY